MPDRLYRSRGDRMLLGVAGGLARYLNVDPSIVRLVWVLLVFAGGAGILLYIVAAIVIPEESSGLAADPTVRVDPPAIARRVDGNGAIIVGLVLVLVGGWLLAQRFLPGIDGRVAWPIVMMVLGVVGALRGPGGERP